MRKSLPLLFVSFILCGRLGNGQVLEETQTVSVVFPTNSQVPNGGRSSLLVITTSRSPIPSSSLSLTTSLSSPVSSISSLPQATLQSTTTSSTQNQPAPTALILTTSATAESGARSSKHGLSAGAIAGIAVTVVLVFMAILGCFYIRRRRQSQSKHKPHPYLSSHTSLPSATQSTTSLAQPSYTQPSYTQQHFEDGIIPSHSKRPFSSASFPSQSPAAPFSAQDRLFSPISPATPLRPPLAARKDSERREGSRGSTSSVAELEGCAAKQPMELEGREVAIERIELPDFEQWERDEEAKKRDKRLKRGMSWLSLS